MIHYITTNGIGNAWVAAELRVMDRKGIPWVLHSMRSSGGHFYRSTWARDIDRSTRLIYPLPLVATGLSVLLAIIIFRERFVYALLNALFAERESLRVRIAGIAHFFVACHWARTLRQQEVSHIHSQWIHSCGTIGMYGAWLLGVPFSFTGHAVDLFRERAALRDKIRRAEFIVCISRFHREFYKSLGAHDDQLHVVYCGIDCDQFDFHLRPARPMKRIVSLGRLVEKKGFDDLICACAVLQRRGVEFRCEIAGSGPMEGSLRQLVDDLNLTGRVVITGKAVLHEDLAEWYAHGDVFAQPCVWSRDNDVDGVPRTLMEAMASGLPSVATRLAGIPEVIEHEQSGLLVDPRSPQDLAETLQRLVEDDALAHQLAMAGRTKIEEDFQIDRCLESLAALFRERLLDGPHEHADVGSGESTIVASEELIET